MTGQEGWVNGVSDRLINWAAGASARAQSSGAVLRVQHALHCKGAQAGGEQHPARGGTGAEVALPVS
jgi:hypothetical protein